MPTRRSAVALLVLLLAFSIAWPTLAWTPPVPADFDAPFEGLAFDAFVDESYRLYLLRFPETITYMGKAEEYGIRNDHLDDYSQEYTLETFEIEQLILYRLQQFDQATLTSNQQVTYIIAEWYWEDRVRGQVFADLAYPINHMKIRSLHGGLEFALNEYHPFETESDVIDYLAKLRAAGVQIDQMIDQTSRRRDLGIVLPRTSLEWSLQGIQELAITPSWQHPYYETLSTKMASIEGILSETAGRYRAEAITILDEIVRPAYRRLYDVQLSLYNDAPVEISLSQFENGMDAYRALLRHHTQTDLSPAEIHDLGLQNVERIQAEIRAAATALNAPDTSSMAAIFEFARTEGGSTAGEESVEKAQDLIEYAEELAISSGAFPRLPTADVIARSIGYGGYYSRPAADGSRPGTYYVTTAVPMEHFRMPTIAFHETVPGHHLQIALAQELDVSLLRQSVSFTGFVEGWALYAERLMHELGAYAEDPFGNLGRLQYELRRAVRLVVDTGIHAFGWSLNEAVDYFAETLGESRQTATSAALRYTVIPGQATAYMVGMLELLDIRNEVEAVLGDAFSLPEFHDLVLGNGAVPLSFLRELVSDWLTSRTE